MFKPSSLVYLTTNKTDGLKARNSKMQLLHSTETVLNSEKYMVTKLLKTEEQARELSLFLMKKQEN